MLVSTVCYWTGFPCTTAAPYYYPISSLDWTWMDWTGLDWTGFLYKQRHAHYPLSCVLVLVLCCTESAPCINSGVSLLLPQQSCRHNFQPNPLKTPLSVVPLGIIMVVWIDSVCPETPFNCTSCRGKSVRSIVHRQYADNINTISHYVPPTVLAS